MPYFKLMRAINLYVAVDWQGDREIERRRGEGGDSLLSGWRKKGRTVWALEGEGRIKRERKRERGE